MGIPDIPQIILATFSRDPLFEGLRSGGVPLLAAHDPPTTVEKLMFLAN
jgi:hypothetical protein